MSKSVVEQLLNMNYNINALATNAVVARNFVTMTGRYDVGSMIPQETEDLMVDLFNKTIDNFKALACKVKNNKLNFCH